MARAPWIERWRDRLQTSERLRRWAIAFPLTRPLARRRAAQLFDLMAGFVYSQVLLACVRLDVFNRLAEGAQDAASLAAQWRMATPRAERLLEAAAALRLLERRSGGRYGLGALGAPLVGDAGLAALVEHHAMLYADLADPLALLRRTERPTALGAYWPYGEEDGARALPPEAVAAYSALMTASQPLVAQEILDAYPMHRHRMLLDVAGGEGGFAIAAAARHPLLQVTVFDLPAVAERAHARLQAAGLGARGRAVGGDFARDALPRGADLVTLVRVVHDHDDERAEQLLRAVRAAIAPGGTLLLAEPMAGTPGAEAMGSAYFGFYLLAMGHGRARTKAELAAMLARAGFSRVRPLATRMPLQVGLLQAQAQGDLP